MGNFRERTASIPKEGLLRLVPNQSSRGNFSTGEYIHRAGIVTILVAPTTPGRPLGYTRLDTVIDGRQAMRTFDRQYAERYLSRLCRDLLGVAP